MKKEYQEIKALVTSFPNQFTYQQVANEVGVTYEQVRNCARRNDLQGFFSKGNQGGIITSESSSLQGGSTMSRQPSKAELSAFQQHCIEHNLPFDNWRAFWHKTKEYSALFANKEAEKELRDQHENLLADLKKQAPKYRKRKVDPRGEHMLILPQSDIHVGKWSEIAGVGSDYNINIALERAEVGTDELVAKGKLFGVNQFVVCLGNDVLHTENGKTTTSGTPQDTDGTWFHNFRMAMQLYVVMIERLALHADVLLVHMPSNHDWRSGYALSEAVAARFAHHANVKSMVTERHRKYLIYGNNLIMFTHGDGAKEQNLHWLMKTVRLLASGTLA